MVNMKDVWNIDMVGRTSRERTGYATQKPEHLIARMIECCTKEGDLCADFFCGDGTACRRGFHGEDVLSVATREVLQWKARSAGLLRRTGLSEFIGFPIRESPIWMCGWKLLIPKFPDRICAF